MPAVHILLFSAESSVAGYALRHRAQQYSGRRKKCFCHRFLFARFATAQAFFHLPTYRCLSSTFSDCSSKGICHRSAMFLQHIAGIPFPDSKSRFIPAVYALPSPRTAVCRYTRMGLMNYCSGIPSYRCLCQPSQPLRIHRFDRKCVYNNKCVVVHLPMTRIRKNKKKESKVIPSGKCCDNIKPLRVF